MAGYSAKKAGNKTYGPEEKQNNNKEQSSPTSKVAEKGMQAAGVPKPLAKTAAPLAEKLKNLAMPRPLQNLNKKNRDDQNKNGNESDSSTEDTGDKKEENQKPGLPKAPGLGPKKPQEKDEEENNESSESNDTGSKAVKKAGQMMGKIASALLPMVAGPIAIMIIVMVVVAAVSSFFLMIGSFFTNMFSAFEVSNNHLGYTTGSTNFFSSEDSIGLSDKYLAELDKLHDKYGDKIDYDLITATLFSEQYLMDFVDSEEIEGLLDGNITDENGNLLDPNDSDLTEEQKEAIENRELREQETIEKLELLAEKQDGDTYVKKETTTSTGTNSEDNDIVYTGEITDISQYFIDLWVDYGGFYQRGYTSDHSGLDISANEGAPIYSPIAGTVVFAGDGANGGIADFGNVVVVDDANGYEHVFSHMVDGSIKVSVGDEVTVGTNLGGVGNTGYSTGNHLHYAIYKNSGCMSGGVCNHQSSTDPELFYGSGSGNTNVTEGTTGNENSLQYIGPVDDLAEFYAETIPGTVMTSPFGWREGNAIVSSNHKGVDFAPTGGRENYHELLSPIEGTVTRSVPNGNGNGYGAYVVIQEDHGENRHLLAHFSYGTINLKEGDKVGVGDYIGKMGSTGNSTGTHVHHEVITPENTYLDPITYFKETPPASSGFIGGNNVTYSEELITLEEWHNTNYYQFLINEFIVDYYDDYLPSEEEQAERDRAVYEMADNIYEIWKQYKQSMLKSSSNVGQTCKYTANDGTELTNVKVELLECWGSSEPIDTELVDLEKYITGVVYAEVGAFGVEAHKVQSIAARSYLFTRGDQMPSPYGDIRQENGYTVISIRNCTADQVYCDPDLGCHSNSSTAGDTVYSGQNSGAALSKPPLSEDSEIRTAVQETTGQVLVNGEGKIQYTTYTAGNGQTQWQEMAESGMGYQQIIVDWYERTLGSNLSLTSTCINDIEGLTVPEGGYSKNIVYYSQNDYPNDSFGGYGTFADMGCAPTSYAMVASTMLGEPHLPLEQMRYVCPDNCGTFGTSYAGVDAFAKEYPELEVSEQISVMDQAQLVLDTLASGDSLILITTYQGETIMSRVAHTMILTGINENGEITVADPWSEESSAKTYTVEEMLASAEYAWTVKLKG